MTIDRTADLFHDLLIKPELERLKEQEEPVTFAIFEDFDLKAFSNRPLNVTVTIPYQPHSPTSRAAAELALPKAGTQRRRVYDFLVGCGPRGATDDEMQARLGMNPSTQRPRRIELMRAELITEAAETNAAGQSWMVRRKTASGRDAVVWVAV